MIRPEITYWLLWQCISGEGLKVLMKHQWDNWGTHLDIADQVRQTRPSLYHPELDLDEIDKIMRGRPRSGRIKGEE